MNVAFCLLNLPIEMISSKMKGTHRTSCNRKGMVKEEGRDVEPTSVILKHFPLLITVSSRPS